MEVKLGETTIIMPFATCRKCKIPGDMGSVSVASQQGHQEGGGAIISYYHALKVYVASFPISHTTVQCM